MTTSRFNIDSLEIILSLNSDNCYIEILETAVFNKYALIIDKMIIDDIRTIPNIKQMFKILKTALENFDDDEQEETRLNININPSHILLTIKIITLIETEFNLKIPKIKVDDNIEINKLQKELLNHKNKILSLENIISKLQNDLKLLNEKEYIYTISEYNHQKVNLCGCDKCSCGGNMPHNRIRLLISERDNNIYLRCYEYNNYAITERGITLYNYKNINKINHKLELFEIENTNTNPVILPAMKVNINKLVIKDKVILTEFFNNNIQISIIEIHNDCIANISVYFDRIKGLKEIKIINSPNLRSNDVGLRKKYNFDIIYA